MTTRLRFGVVGTGPWAHMVHVPAAAASPRVRLAAVYGRDVTRARQLAQRPEAAADDAVAFGVFDEFLDAVDVVGFAVPPTVQPELVEQALLTGKHVLVEKPVALEPAQADRLAAIAAQRGLRSVVFFTHRFIPELVRWTDELVATGGWAHARVVSHSSLLRDPTNPFSASPWRHEHGALWDIGPHALARVCAVLGPVARASAVRGPGDRIDLELVHESGATSSVSLASDAVDPEPGCFEVSGVAGVRSEPDTGDWTLASGVAYRAALDQLVDEIEGACAGACDLAFGAHVTRVLAAA